MPFTLAHPGFILFLKQKWPKYFSLNALICGSISPDLALILSQQREILDNFNFFEQYTLALFLGLIIYFIAIRINFENSTIKNSLLSLNIGIIVHYMIDYLGHVPQYLHISENESVFSVFFLLYLSQFLMTFLGLGLILSHLSKESELKNSKSLLNFKSLLIHFCGFFSFCLAIHYLKYHYYLLEPEYQMDHLALSFTLGIFLYAPIFLTYNNYKKGLAKRA